MDNYNTVIFCAGIFDYQKINRNYLFSKKINVENTINLIKKFLIKDKFVCFLSSNLVFQSIKQPNELSKPNSKFAYSHFKILVEKELIKFSKKKKLFNKICILRMTKNIDHNTRPFDQWIKTINDKKKIYPFSDMFFSPIRFKDSCMSIYKIINKKISGIIHLSGAKDLSYSEFAIALMNAKKINHKNLLEHTTTKKSKKKIFYKNKYTKLSMTYSKKKLGMRPVNFKKVIFELSKKINNENN